MQQLLHRGAAMTQHRTDEILDASWDDLKSFLACARHRSFRNAADLLGVTSTTLMRRIDRLEERIGCKLFLRDQSGLTISEEGLAMLADVTEMERHAFNIFRRASQSSNTTSGTVRVAVTEGPGNFWILPRLIDFQKPYGIPTTLAELKNHRIIKQNAPQVDDSAYARILGLTSLEGVVGIKTNSSISVLYAVERGAGG